MTHNFVSKYIEKFIIHIIKQYLVNVNVKLQNYILM